MTAYGRFNSDAYFTRLFGCCTLRYSLICHVDKLAFPFIGDGGVSVGGDMGTLVFACPATGEEVSTGIEMDLATLERLRLEKIYCPHCRQPHHLAAIEYWLTEIASMSSAAKSVTTSQASSF